jgi:hypothetical protein
MTPNLPCERKDHSFGTPITEFGIASTFRSCVSLSVLEVDHRGAHASVVRDNGVVVSQ